MKSWQQMKFYLVIHLHNYRKGLECDLDNKLKSKSL
jgi:hypothetical protein